jgi:hypothetical protein
MKQTGCLRRARNARTAAPVVVLAVALAGLAGACSSGSRPAAGSAAPIASQVPGAASTSPGGTLPPAESPPGTPRPTTVVPPRPAPAPNPVPAGFRAWSVTFVSDREAYVLGDAACRQARCTSVVHTLDGGRSWQREAAPSAPLPPDPEFSAPTPPAAVRDIRFATSQDGYAFGQSLWTTHDGARSWRRVTSLGSVQDLQTDGHTVYAIAANCTSGPCTGGRLLTSPVTADAFRPAAVSADSAGGVSIGGGTTVVMTGDGIYVKRGTGGWTRAAEPCQPHYGGVIAPASGTTLIGFCEDGAAGSIFFTFLRSTDLGRHWSTVTGQPLQLHGQISLTAGSASLLAGAWAMPDLHGTVQVSRDGGRTWAEAGLPRTAAGWRYVGARSGTALVALQEPPAAVLWTSDTAGRTWTAHPIR